MRQDLRQRRAELRPLISAIGEELLQKWKQPEQRREHQNAAVAILDIGRMHNGVQQQALRIDENVALLALDLLSRIIAGGSIEAPLFRRFSRFDCR